MTRAWVPAVLAVLVVTLPAPAAAAPSDQDGNFLVAAHQAAFAQIELGRLAQQKGTAPVVRELGGQIAADHVELDERVRQSADSLGVALPGEPTAAQRKAARQLADRNGAAFDRSWIDVQMREHDALMDAIQAELSSGQDQQARQVAADIQPVIASHHDALAKAKVRLSPPAKVESGLGGLAPPPADLLAVVGLGLLLLAAGVWLRLRESR
ncbi:MAG: DUF4142 domain-containing protein [Hamadaea sp.]|nr:DUF4142 domain-containing protein [Hamadaea sp.]